ncbi:MAG: phage tail protein [Gammaproteobacteria bacterium]
MKFALACEGATDLITIENILYGYFEKADLDGEITQLQPRLDETDSKQQGFGGWQELFKYLASTRFRDDVLNSQFVVLQVDTDVSEEAGFDVKQRDEENSEFEPIALIQKVIEKLIQTIESGESGFYQKYADKLLFCICVHSIECWIYAHYNREALKKPKITGCYKALGYYLNDKGVRKSKDFAKTYRCYDELTRPFLQRKNIDAAARKDPSLRVFIGKLQSIENML